LFNKSGFCFDITSTWIRNVIVISIELLQKSRFSLCGVSFVVIKFIFIIIVTPFCFQYRSSSSWNRRLKVLKCFLLSLFLHINPVEIDVEINVLFHLSQIHIVEVTNECNIRSNIQFVNDVRIIKSEITYRISISLLVIRNCIWSLSSFSLDVSGYNFEFEVLSNIRISIFNSIFVQFLIISILRNLCFGIISDESSKLSDIKVIVVVLIV